MIVTMMMSSKSVEWLQEELESGAGSLLLLDCRPHELYESSHIESAINLAIPGLMLRRLKKGNLPIRSIIPNNEDKEKFVKRCKTDVVVLYDEASPERQESGLGSSVLGLLLQKLRDDGCKAFFLEGKTAGLGVVSLFLIQTHQRRGRLYHSSLALGFPNKQWAINIELTVKVRSGIVL